MVSKEYRAEYRRARISHHLCARCGNEDTHTRAGYTLCFSCAVSETAKALRYYYRNRDRVRAQQAEYRSRKRKERAI